MPAPPRPALQDVAALEALALALGRATDPAACAAALVGFAAAPGSAAVVLAGADGQLALLAAEGVPLPPEPRTVRPTASPLLAAALTTGAVQRTSDVGADAWLAAHLPSAPAAVAVPLHADDRPCGVLVLERSDRPDADLARAAGHTALALRRAWTLEQVRRLAATDGLTKIANRRTFEATLEREVARSLRSGEPLSLVLLDLDHFKRLNDSEGHQAGDEVLRNVAFALTCECRDFDTPARYGGEEFAVVLPGCGLAEALDTAERLRRAVSAAPAALPTTASAGVATFPAHAKDADGLVRAADEALYRAKAAGRDRSTVSDGVLRPGTEELLRRAVAARLGEEQSPD